ncbi:MAG: hypothetical protein ACR2QT_04185 [Woeseiaceae bacterium]
MQWLDDLDDLVAAIGLMGERIRNFAISLATLAACLVLPSAGVILALRHPPLALASAIILFVTLLYRSVTQPRVAFRQTA